ncbi:MAG: hypothetical protein U5L02_01035 [Rheinheimera sp.]|nr:hypothetical protein [Rheinheimera sp.]
MLHWLLAQLIPLTLLLVVLLGLRPLLLQHLGARLQYSLWLAVPLLLLWSLFPLQWMPVTDFAVYRVQQNMQQISAELPTDSLWTTGLLVIWLLGMGVMGLGVWQQQRNIRQALSTAAVIKRPGFCAALQTKSGCARALCNWFLAAYSVTSRRFPTAF